MNKQEFESRIGATVSQKQFEIINHVYTFHPLIRDVGGKEQIAQLYKLGGMLLMRNMYSYVLKCEETERRLTNAEGRIAELQEKLAGCDDRIAAAKDEQRRIEEELRKAGNEANTLRRRFNELVTFGTEQNMAS